MVVTGSRIVRDGYNAPTPVTVMSRDQINDFSPSNIADMMKQIPSFAGNSTPQSSRLSVSAGGAGINSLNLRNMGTTRTLVLLDGQRVVGSQPTGQVDINTFPQQLIQRVEVVTGGASAAYGSDAVSGVVNFILDRRFTGFKADVQGGVTSEGDNRQQKFAAAGGMSFADQRGHILLSAEYAKVDGIHSCPRSWCEQGWNLINNPDYTPGSGLPERLVLPSTAWSSSTLGGLINSGPLAGTAFGIGGVPFDYEFGPLRDGTWMQGGDWQLSDVKQLVSLNPDSERQNFFARVSYEVTDNTEVFAQWSRGGDDSLTIATPHFNPSINIRGDNAFIPDVIRARMAEHSLTSLRIGSFNDDLDAIASDNTRDLDRVVVGADGNFEVFGSRWDWNAYYQRGETTVVKSFYDRIITPFNNAIDSVVHPNTGEPVCRSTLSDPGNGCVPWNIFGTGVNSQQAIDYVAGWSWARETNKQEVVAASFAGSPLTIPTGDVSLALGVEHRVESGGGREGPINLARQSWVGNQAPTFGRYNVTEGFVETVVPVLDGPMSADVNAAVRLTDYSTSGTVNTWKIGGTFSPLEAVILRATRSRDIRAPHRQELFAAGVYTGNVVVDPFRDNQLTDVQSLLRGNIQLNPEEADTTGLGVVYQPSWLPGFSTALDYYNIEITGAIGTVGRQEVIDRCFRGENSFCDALERNAEGVITIVNIQPTNFVSELARGIDIEASYTMPLVRFFAGTGGDLTFRALGTRSLKNSRDTGSSPKTDSVGENGGNGPPTWKYRASATYSNDVLRTTLTARGISSGVYNNTNIACTIGCPNSTSLNRTVNINDLPGALYFDAALTYQLPKLFGAQAEAFFVIQNLMNKDPAIVAQGPGGVPSTPPANPQHYDLVGREFRLGFRVNL